MGVGTLLTGSGANIILPGSNKDRVNLYGQQPFFTSDDILSSSAEVGFEFNATTFGIIDIRYYTAANLDLTLQFNWLDSPGETDANLYELFVSPTQGTFTTGTTGSWLNLGSPRLFYVSRVGIGIKSVTAVWFIRRVGTTKILCSTTMGLSAIVE